MDMLYGAQRPSGYNNSIYPPGYPQQMPIGGSYSDAVKTAQGANTQATQIQVDAYKQAMREYMDWMQKALDQQRQSGNQATMAQLLGAQLGAQQMQQGMIPMQMAALSGLQSLPILQKMAGVQAYAMPTSINTSVPNYIDQFTRIMGGQTPTPTQPSSPIPGPLYGQGAPSGGAFGGNMLYSSEAARAAQPSWLNNPSGGGISGGHMLANRIMLPPSGTQTAPMSLPPSIDPLGPSGAQPAPMSPSPGGTGSGVVSLTPTNPEVNPQASELYKWQQKENERLLRQQLAARGLLGSGTGAELESRMNSQLSAQESANQYNRVMDLVKIGMGAAGQAGNWTQQMGQIPINLGSGIAGTQMDLGRGISSLYGGIGGAQMGTTQTIGGMQGQNLISNAQLALQEAMMRNNPYLYGGMQFGMPGMGGGGMYGGGYGASGPFTFGRSVEGMYF